MTDLKSIPSLGLAYALGDGLKDLARKERHPLLVPLLNIEDPKTFNSMFFGDVLLYTDTSEYIRSAMWTVQYAPHGVEPDVVLSIPRSKYLSKDSVQAFINGLPSILPMLEYNANINDDDASQMAKVHISRSSLITAFQACKVESLSRSFSKLKKLVTIHTHALEMSNKPDATYSYDSYFAASLAKGKLAESPILTTKDLDALLSLKCEERLDAVEAIQRQPAVWALNKNASLRTTFLNVFEQLGIHQTSYFANGLDSVAFQPEGNDNFSETLLLLSPIKHLPYLTILHLPSYMCGICEKTMYRIMPKLPVHGSEQAAFELQNIFKKYGLEPFDVEPYNVGYYQFEQKRVPMIFDWGAGDPVGSLKIREKLLTSPELEPWREAHRHAMTIGNRMVAAACPM